MAQGPYDQEHQYLQWGGTLPGAEQWSCGVRLAKSTANPVTQDQVLCDALATVVGAFHQRATTGISSAAHLTWVKLNPIGVDGKYLFPTTIEKLISPLKAGGKAVATYMPNQVAWAVTLTTAVDRGGAHIGRFYLPLPAVGPDSGGGEITLALCNDLKASATTFINDINAATASYHLAVFSRKAGDPKHRTVTGVKVGRVLDTIRRRRNQLAEKYV